MLLDKFSFDVLLISFFFYAAGGSNTSAVAPLQNKFLEITYEKIYTNTQCVKLIGSYKK